ncbi:MAG: hypothetical protein ACJAZN_000172 [Planctomycetota bacterium]|jgi:hypothetical protein
MYLTLTALAVTLSCGAVAMSANDGSDQQTAHREFGDVQWGRELEPALASAAESKKPVMLLFQEVPG